MSGLTRFPLFLSPGRRLLPTPAVCAAPRGRAGRRRLDEQDARPRGRHQRPRPHPQPETAVVRISVEDQGPGVPVELRESIFEPFVTTKPQGSGTGLGLSVSKSILMDLGGALYLDASFTPGARFVVELPVTDQAAPPAEGDQLPTSEGLRILLIDDDREILETYEVILSLDNHQVTSCDRGKKALEVLESDSFDAILCDVRLPDLRGTEFLEILSVRNPELAARVIFATGDVVNASPRAFLAAGSTPATSTSPT